MRKSLLTIAFLSGLCLAGAQAQETPEPQNLRAFAMPPADSNNFQTIVAPPQSSPAIKVAIYEGKGTTEKDVKLNIVNITNVLPNATVTRIREGDWGTADLSQYQVVVFPGGSGSGQGNAMGEAGRNNVREFVRNGGGFYGVCAGDYLAMINYSWSLGIINAKTIYPKWLRGRDMATVEASPAIQNVIGDTPKQWRVMYSSGPIFVPADRADLPAYTPLATFRSEVRRNNNPEGEMLNKTAHALATFGKGRVFISSPHPEYTPGLENFMAKAVLWAAGMPTE